MFDLGFQELIVIFLVALLVVGPKKLPELGRTLGKWIVEIRQGIHSARMQVEREFDEIDKTEHRPADELPRADEKSEDKETDSQEQRPAGELPRADEKSEDKETDSQEQRPAGEFPSAAEKSEDKETDSQETQDRT